MASEYSNFRITTDYIFELYDVKTNKFYKVWVAGEDGHAQLRKDVNPDEDGVALDIDPRVFPSGNIGSNYRVKNNILQIYNVDTHKYHSIFISGNRQRTAISILPNGEA